LDPPSTAKLGSASVEVFIFLKALFQYNFVCKKSDCFDHWLTRGVAFYKGWSKISVHCINSFLEMALNEY